ncbi:uncharacterized protein BDZ99DRAFT_485283 [Mytilinidion resinicola]|uniref:Inositolphosphotransferase Aur1/Ipt1 domain-containing protein n=1 Tax=Mytilinidion resinicola TaxID=574789 RepID=A0A6A6Z1G1_9PEZI|nr:uncharacterized protein BDZ99DRAFT_485283 [Mytilinidion resinicola]KAF2814638.1 hypothetical protein BDZ99DRAFT_485283 [Mytilinidion resinicola]
MTTNWRSCPYPSVTAAAITVIFAVGALINRRRRSTRGSYQLARAYSAYIIREDDYVFSLARVHALHVLSQEERWGINFELRVQSYILHSRPYLMTVLGKVYYSHIVVGAAFVVYCFTVLPPALFQSIRRTIAINNMIAFIMITCWRCMPPRLLPPDAWTQNRFQLTIAAMPSLHFGTALFIGTCLSRFSPHRWVRWFSPLWPLLMFVTIIATANHFVLDAIIGATVPAMGWRINEAMLLFRPLEKWVFWLLRTERPTLSQGP